MLRPHVTARPRLLSALSHRAFGLDVKRIQGIRTRHFLHRSAPRASRFLHRRSFRFKIST